MAYKPIVNYLKPKHFSAGKNNILYASKYSIKTFFENNNDFSDGNHGNEFMTFSRGFTHITNQADIRTRLS